MVGELLNGVVGTTGILISMIFMTLGMDLNWVGTIGDGTVEDGIIGVGITGDGTIGDGTIGDGIVGETHITIGIMEEGMLIIVIYVTGEEQPIVTIDDTALLQLEELLQQVVDETHQLTEIESTVVAPIQQGVLIVIREGLQLLEEIALHPEEVPIQDLEITVPVREIEEQVQEEVRLGANLQ